MQQKVISSGKVNTKHEAYGDAEIVDEVSRAENIAKRINKNKEESGLDNIEIFLQSLEEKEKVNPVIIRSMLEKIQITSKEHLAKLQEEGLLHGYDPKSHMATILKEKPVVEKKEDEIEELPDVSELPERTLENVVLPGEESEEEPEEVVEEPEEIVSEDSKEVSVEKTYDIKCKKCEQMFNTTNYRRKYCDNCK